MRRLSLIALLAGTIAVSAERGRATTFQNLDFEEYTPTYPASSNIPHWDLVMQRGDGEILFQGQGPSNIGDGYPFVGFHAGDGPVIGVNGDGIFPGFPNHLQGKYSVTLFNYDDGRSWPTEDLAQAALADMLIGGIVQTAVVPVDAKSIWIAARSPAASNLGMYLSGHRVELEAATPEEAILMFLASGLTPPPWLLNPAPSTFFLAGNIETVAGLNRELKILPTLSVAMVGGQPLPAHYEVGTTSINFDMIVFSPLAWDGPPVSIPEPQCMAMMVWAVCMTVLRRRNEP